MKFKVCVFILMWFVAEGLLAQSSEEVQKQRIFTFTESPTLNTVEDIFKPLAPATKGIANEAPKVEAQDVEYRRFVYGDESVNFQGYKSELERLFLKLNAIKNSDAPELLQNTPQDLFKFEFSLFRNLFNSELGGWLKSDQRFERFLHAMSELDGELNTAQILGSLNLFLIKEWLVAHFAQYEKFLVDYEPSASSSKASGLEAFSVAKYYESFGFFFSGDLKKTNPKSVVDAKYLSQFTEEILDFLITTEKSQAPFLKKSVMYAFLNAKNESAKKLFSSLGWSFKDLEDLERQLQTLQRYKPKMGWGGLKRELEYPVPAKGVFSDMRTYAFLANSVTVGSIIATIPAVFIGIASAVGGASWYEYWSIVLAPYSLGALINYFRWYLPAKTELKRDYQNAYMSKIKSILSLWGRFPNMQKLATQDFIPPTRCSQYFKK